MSRVPVQSAVEFSRFNVEEGLRSRSRPAHLLFFAKAPIDQLVHSRFHVRRSDSFTVAESAGVTRYGLAVRVQV
jgi:hypothetical protein